MRSCIEKAERCSALSIAELSVAHFVLVTMGQQHGGAKAQPQQRQQGGAKARHQNATKASLNLKLASSR
eukprot:4572086-Amphidinium_carterae.1